MIRESTFDDPGLSSQIVTSRETLFVAKTTSRKNTASVQNPFGILNKSKNESAGVKESERNCKNKKMFVLKQSEVL